MSHEISPLQTLALWSLLVRGGTGLQKDIKSTFEKKDREALVAAGLITAEKNKQRAYVLQVTDKGWHWAGTTSVDCAVPRSTAAADVLQALLARLGAFLQAHDIALVEILTTAPASPTNEASTAEPLPGRAPRTPTSRPTDLRERVRTAFLRLTGGQLNTRVRLADLRALLSDLDRATQDTAIFAVAGDADADLLQLDNRIDITDADRDSALQVGSEPRHLLWISK